MGLLLDAYKRMERKEREEFDRINAAFPPPSPHVLYIEGDKPKTRSATPKGISGAGAAKPPPFTMQ